ncbi:MAG: secondary thiamine-phosphate synthase enzyme YjbQ [Candidatus Omnitrophica bacterium]|nr:secondary thiamine-phosphate synthase enzyme YjbQ [Candidatus Omnitrophota bacterium]
MERFTVRSTRRVEFLNITARVQNAVAQHGLQDGLCTVFIPHTTAAVTINENADPDAVADMIQIIGRLIPQRGDYCHTEGNSDAHMKASLLGCAQTIVVEQGILQLGTWQGIYLAEFDGPRTRTAWVKCLPTHGKEVR